MEKIKKTEEIEDQNTNEKDIKESAKKAALEKVKQKVAIVNVNEIAEAEAHKAADDHMTRSAGEKINIFKKIWKHTFADAYYRQKEINRVKSEIKEKDNIYAGRIDNNKSFHDDAMKSISERFIADYDGTLSEGEKKKTLDDKDGETKKTKDDIKNLIISYAQGNITEEAFKNEKVRIIDNLKSDELLKGPKDMNSYADNLLEIAQNARLAIEHGAKIEELELSTDVIIGKAKSSLKTEAHFNAVDKVVDKLKKSPVGRFVNPATMSLAIGIAYSASVGIGKKVMTSKLAAWGTFGASVAASTLIMGANESHRVTEERKQHGLEMAEGGTFNEGDKRREKINKYQYQMESSGDLANQLRSLMFEKDANGNEIPKDIKQEDIDGIMSNLANIEARNQLNSKNKIDLISYSNIGNVEKERTDLTILVAQTKVALRKKIEGEFAGNFDNKKFDEILEKQSKVIEDALLGGEEGIDEKDKAFSKYKTKRVASKMFWTGVSGLVVGATVQEIVSWFNGNVQGNIEAILGKNTNATIQTPLEHIREWMMGNSNVSMENAFPFNINGHEFTLPEGTNIVNNGDGTFNILRGGNVISDHIQLGFDSSGALDQESIVRLGQDGILANATCSSINIDQTGNISAEEYLKTHPDAVHNISHDGWYDNGTPSPIFDHNELRLQWEGTGIDTNGNYVLDVSHMTSDGSLHNEFSVDAQEKIKNGGLKIILSLTEGTQNHAFEVPIDVNGNAVIDPNSEIGKLFFENQNGHAVFTGRFAEVVESFGSQDGVEHVKTLATLEGPGNDSILSTIPGSTDITINNLGMPIDTEMPYFIPLVGRNPLESIKQKDNVQGDKKPEGSGIATVIKTEETHQEDGKEVPVILNTEGDKIEKQKTLNEISKEEYDAMYDDLKMINRKIQTSKGIITLSRDDFKSEYGKKRYMDLKSIPEGVPVRFNKTELQTIGDELEGLLSNSKVISKEDLAKKLEKGKEITDQEKSKRAYEIYEKRLKEGKEGNQDGDWFEAERQLKEEQKNSQQESSQKIDEIETEIENVSDNKRNKSSSDEIIVGEKKTKKETVIFDQDGNEINKKKEVTIFDQDGKVLRSKKIEEIKAEIKKDIVEKEKVKISETTPSNSTENKDNFKIEDLSKVGTEFENDSYTFKIKSISSPFWGFGKTDIKLEATKKGTKEISEMESTKKALENLLTKKQIKITKVLEETKK